MPAPLNFDAFANTILLTRAGSRSFGTHIDSSDVDVRGVVVPPLAHLVGLEHFEQVDQHYWPETFSDPRFLSPLSPVEQAVVATSKLDGAIYSIVKFTQMCLGANPSILDVLFCRDEDVLISTPAGEALRDIRSAFLSKKVKATYSGYAKGQLERIKRHRRWLQNPPKEKPTREAFGLIGANIIPTSKYDAAASMVKAHLDGLELNLSGIDDATRIEVRNQIRYSLETVLSGVLVDQGDELDVENARWHSAMNHLGFDTNFMTLIEGERRYRSAKNEWDEFQEWQRSRNPARAELEAKMGYDGKHAMHLIRLLRQCGEVLRTGTVHVWREDAKDLLEIRNGKYTFEELVKESERLDYTNSVLVRSTSLCETPDTLHVHRVVESLLRARL